MREKRDEIIILRTTKSEKNRIYEKMLGMGIRSLSAYIRLRHRLDELIEIGRQILSRLAEL